MISRTTIGRSFAGVVRYQFEGRKQQPSEKQAEILVAVGVREMSAHEMTADFNRRRKLNPNLVQAVWHTSLSFNPDDAARLDSELMGRIAEDYVQKMGLDQTQYVIIRHHDQPENQHLHIIANRVGNDGKTIKDGRNFYRSKKVLQELIQTYGLTPPQGLRPEKQHPAQLQGVDKAKYAIKEALRIALATATDGKGLQEQLRAQQITWQVFRTKEGTPVGISFEKGGQTFKGSAIGRAYSLAGIQKQLRTNAQVAAEAAARQQQRQQQAVKERQEQAALVQKWQEPYQLYRSTLTKQNAQTEKENQVTATAHEVLLKTPTLATIRQLLSQQKAGALEPALTACVQAEQKRQQAVQWAEEEQKTLEKSTQNWKAIISKKVAQESDMTQQKLAILANPTAWNPAGAPAELQKFAQRALLAKTPFTAPALALETYQQAAKSVVSPLYFAQHYEKSGNTPEQVEQHWLEQKWGPLADKWLPVHEDYYKRGLQKDKPLPRAAYIKWLEENEREQKQRQAQPEVPKQQRGQRLKR